MTKVLVSAGFDLGLGVIGLGGAAPTLGSITDALGSFKGSASAFILPQCQAVFDVYGDDKTGRRLLADRLNDSQLEEAD